MGNLRKCNSHEYLKNKTKQTPTDSGIEVKMWIYSATEHKSCVLPILPHSR